MPHLRAKDAFHVADDVHHVRIALHFESLGDLHAARAGDAAYVIARQINQHQVLGALFGVLPQFGLQCSVLLGRAATWPSARQGANRHFAAVIGQALFSHQNFR